MNLQGIQGKRRRKDPHYMAEMTCSVSGFAWMSATWIRSLAIKRLWAYKNQYFESSKIQLSRGLVNWIRDIKISMRKEN